MTPMAPAIHLVFIYCVLLGLNLSWLKSSGGHILTNIHPAECLATVFVCLTWQQSESLGYTEKFLFFFHQNINQTFVILFSHNCYINFTSKFNIFVHYNNVIVHSPLTTKNALLQIFSTNSAEPLPVIKTDLTILIKVKVTLTLEQAMKAPRGSR